MNEAKILEEKENPLFSRKEIALEVESNKVPSYAEAEKVLSEKFKTSPESVAIKKILGKFGSKTFRIDANIYLSKEEKEATEPKPKVKKAAGGK